MERDTYVVKLPRSLDFSNAFKFVEKLRSTPQTTNLHFDFTPLSWIEPFALLIVSSEIQNLVSRFPEVECKAILPEKISPSLAYAAHMGFFQSFGLEIGKFPGEAGMSRQYVPMMIFDCEEIRKTAIEERVAIGDKLEKIAMNLARPLSNADSGALFETLTYSLREVMRNVVEHSEAKQFGCCAQMWPQKQRVELALLDRGVGIRRTLSQNPKLEVNSDLDALRIALLPGISGAHKFGHQFNEDDPWSNSGYGLYMTSSLCRRGGSFFIASGQAGLYLKGMEKTELSKPFSGTALRLVLDTSRITELGKTLEYLRDHGEEISAAMKKTGKVTASLASLHLSKDFRK